jgi:hypothetical protein
MYVQRQPQTPIPILSGADPVTGVDREWKKSAPKVDRLPIAYSQL